MKRMSKSSPNRKASAWKRFWGLTPPGGFAAPPPNLDLDIEPEIAAYWSWLRDGCWLEPKASKRLQLMRHACLTDIETDLGFLAQHSSPWIRLAVASNPAAPTWAVWGTRSAWLGLVGDTNPWVAASALLRHPYPPPSIVAEIARDDSNPAISNGEPAGLERKPPPLINKSIATMPVDAASA